MTEDPDPKAKAAYPLKPDSPHALADGEPSRFFLIDVCGLNPSQIAVHCETIKSVMKSRKLIPVFVTDLDDFRVFRDNSLIFEALPPIASSTHNAPDLDWTQRHTDLRNLLHRKWQPVGDMKLSPDGSGLGKQ